MDTQNEAGRLIGIDAVMAKTSLSRTTIWRLVRAGDFPASVKLTPGRVTWSEKAVDQWLASRIARAA